MSGGGKRIGGGHDGHVVHDLFRLLVSDRVAESRNERKDQSVIDLPHHIYVVVFFIPPPTTVSPARKRSCHTKRPFGIYRSSARTPFTWSLIYKWEVETKIKTNTGQTYTRKTLRLQISPLQVDAFCQDWFAKRRQRRGNTE